MSKTNVPKTKTYQTAQTQTQTQVGLTQLDLATGLAGGRLNETEERALRMRYGMALALDAKLTFADEAHPETRARVEAIERRVWAHLATDADAQRKRAIIDELREI